MAVTGQRGSHRPHPGDTTGMTSYRKQRDQHARKRAEDNPDAAEIRAQAYAAGFDAAWEPAFLAGWNALAELLTEAGIDVDAVLALDDDEPGDDAPGEDE